MGKLVQGIDHVTGRHGGLGTCCICSTATQVRHILQLNGRSPIIGKGWGCVLCKLKCLGAVAVLCDTCLSRFEAGQEPLREFCNGHPGADGRSSILALSGLWEHDFTKHVGEVNGHQIAGR